MKAIILAAGYATRLYPVTKHYPKPLLKIGGETMMDFITDEINTIPEVDKIYVVTNNRFYSYFENWHNTLNDNNKKKVVVLNDGTDANGVRLGAIGDILFTINQCKIDDDLVIIAGDNYFTYPLKEYYDFFKEKNSDCCCAMEIDDINRLRQLGIAELDENNKLLGMEEKPENPKSNKGVYATYFYTKDTVKLFDKYISEGNPPDAPGNFLSWLYKVKDVYTWIMTGDCYDIGTCSEYLKIRKQFMK
ncbi:MAG: NTP transferase domain-containing protein [Clostridiales bacterium]|nr:NTP transferase domain-containing protein [Clostridiales bacterium]